MKTIYIIIIFVFIFLILTTLSYIPSVYDYYILKQNNIPDKYTPLKSPFVEQLQELELRQRVTRRTGSDSRAREILTKTKQSIINIDSQLKKQT